jgi:hypothetical protein
VDFDTPHTLACPGFHPNECGGQLVQICMGIFLSLMLFNINYLASRYANEMD